MAEWFRRLTAYPTIPTSVGLIPGSKFAAGTFFVQNVRICVIFCFLVLEKEFAVGARREVRVSRFNIHAHTDKLDSYIEKGNGHFPCFAWKGRCMD